MQARRHEGAFRGRAPQMTACAPPNENCAPPSEDCVPKKLTGSGLLECKSRALDSQNSAYRPGIREQELLFRSFGGLTQDFMKLCVYFGMKTFFYFLQDF